MRDEGHVGSEGSSMFQRQRVTVPGVSLGRKCIAACLAMAVILIAAPAARAQDGGSGSDPIVRVEEDWVLSLNEPNDDADSPQFHTVMSPYSGTNSGFAQVLWNYAETPHFDS